MSGAVPSDVNMTFANISVSPTAKSLLRAAGFHTLNEVLQAKPMDLARDLNMSPETTLGLLREIKAAIMQVGGSTIWPRKGHEPKLGFDVEVRNEQLPTTALGMLQEKRLKRQSIVTFCEPLDSMLGSGIPVGEITEICGSPGAGKTQLCTQIAVDVCIPEAFGGMDGEALYIDTEGSFDIHRVKDMGKSMLKHLQRTLQQSAQRVKTADDAERVRKQKEAVHLFDNGIEDVFQRIRVCRVHNYTEQLAIVNSLSSVLKDNPKIKLVCLDSVAFHFRHDFENMAKRTRLLSAHAQALNLIASKYAVAVVVTNQMTTKIVHKGQSNQDSFSYLVPALGESWSHAITSRIVLAQTGRSKEIKIKSKRKDKRTGEEVRETIMENVSIRQASLVKSPSRKQKAVDFIVVQAGIRQVPQSSRKRTQADNQGSTEGMAFKAQKPSI